MNYSFIGKIYKQGGHPYVDVPPKLSDTLVEATGKDGYLPVRVTIEGADYSANLAPRGGGAFRLFITDEMRRAARFNVGEVLSVGLEVVEGSPESEFPPDLAELFRAHPAAQTAFAQQPKQRQHELMRWLLNARDAETRDKQLKYLLEYLTTGQM